MSKDFTEQAKVLAEHLLPDVLVKDTEIIMIRRALDEAYASGAGSMLNLLGSKSARTHEFGE